MSDRPTPETRALRDAILAEQPPFSDALIKAFAHSENLERQRDKLKAIAEWLCNGQVGTSSKAMASVAAGVVPRDNSQPWDPDDFNRCLLLLDAAPAIRDDFPEIAKLSPKWSAIIARWDEIEESFLDEVGLGWCKGKWAPRTYRLIDEAIKSAKGPKT